MTVFGFGKIATADEWKEAEKKVKDFARLLEV
jgi:hypothetical protein